MTLTYAGVLPTAAHNEYRLVRGCQCDRRIQPPGKNHARARRTGENPVTRAPARTPTGPQIRRCRRAAAVAGIQLAIELDALDLAMPPLPEAAAERPPLCSVGGCRSAWKRARHAIGV